MNNSESFISNERQNEESKTEDVSLRGDLDTSTTATERTTKPNEDTFITASLNALQQYNTESVKEDGLLGPIEQTVTACRIDNDELLVAAGCDDGTIKIYMLDQNKYFGHLSFTEDSGNAILDLNIILKRWRPTKNNSMTEHVFLGSDVLGCLYHVHATSKKVLHKIVEEGNQAYALDYNIDGSKFATGGKDCKVRVYDEQKKSTSIVLASSSEIQGHANRILAMKFSPDHPDLLVSGSWDETVKVWDLRSGEVTSSLFGMKVYGDCLDIQGNTILAGHNRDKRQLQLWDLGTRKLIEDIAWDPTPPEQYYDASITAARFSKKNPNYIVAFSGLVRQLRIFDRRNKNTLCHVGSTTGEVNTVDFFNSKDTFLYGGSCGALYGLRIGS